jgi:hypothetical protein
MRSLHGELVRRADEGQPGELRDLGRRGCGEARGRIDSGAHRGAAEREPVDALQRILYALDVVGEHPGVAGPFLPQRDRRGVLHVSAAD